ncbi:hypothetical protein AAG906_037642 [Vitis piasezkii]
MFITFLSIPLKIFSAFPLQEILWISLQTRKMNEENQGNEANKGVLPETIDHGKRKMEEEEEAPNSREQSLNRSCASTSEAGPSTYAGSSMIRTRIKEIPVDKVGYITGTRGQCIREIQSLSKAWIQIIDLPPLALAIIRGTQNQIEDARQGLMTCSLSAQTIQVCIPTYCLMLAVLPQQANRVCIPNQLLSTSQTQ